MANSIEDLIRSIVNEAVSEMESRILSQVIYQTDKTMDVHEAAEHLGVSEKLIYRMCKAKQIPHERYGLSGSRRSTIKFRRSDLESWRAQQRNENYKAQHST